MPAKALHGIRFESRGVRRIVCLQLCRDEDTGMVDNNCYDECMRDLAGKPLLVLIPPES